MVTIADIAKMAGVSTSMVSRAINNKGNVKEANRIKIMKIVEETGYTMNLQAQALRTKRSGLIVFLIPSFDSRFVSELVTDLSHILEDSDYSLVVNNYHHSLPKESLLEKIQKFSSRGVDAIIVFTSDHTLEFIEGLKKIQTPLIMMFSNYDFLPCLSYDVKYSGYLLAKCALEHGYRKIGYIHQDDSLFNEGIEKALKEFHVPVDSNYLLEQDPDVPYHIASEKLAKNLYELEDQPEVFICYLDRIASIMKLNYEAMGGKRITFMGVGNTEYAAIAHLTTIDYHKRDLSYKVLEILNNLEEGKEIQPVHYLSKCELIIRDL